MKALIFLATITISLVCFLPVTKSQVIVGDVNINELEDVTICEVLAYRRLLSMKVVIYVNYGQEIKFGEAKSSTVFDQKTGKKRVFNSTVAAINYMEQNGWEFIDAFAMATGNQSVYHYYFRKKASN